MAPMTVVFDDVPPGNERHEIVSAMLKAGAEAPTAFNCDPDEAMSRLSGVGHETLELLLDSFPIVTEDWLDHSSRPACASLRAARTRRWTRCWPQAQEGRSTTWPRSWPPTAFTEGTASTPS